MSDLKLRSSYHETGHGIVLQALGGTLELLSIRPGQSHAGITFPASLPTWTSDAVASAGDPLPVVPADVRRAFEVRICFALAGEIGEQLMPFEPGFVPTIPCPDDPLSLARQLSDLSPRHRELLEAAESETEHDHDEKLAFRAGKALGNDDEARALVELMRVVTRRIVAENQREMHSVAKELHRYEVLTGDDVRAAKAAAYPPIPGGTVQPWAAAREP